MFNHNCLQENSSPSVHWHLFSLFGFFCFSPIFLHHVIIHGIPSFDTRGGKILNSSYTAVCPVHFLSHHYSSKNMGNNKVISIILLLLLSSFFFWLKTEVIFACSVTWWYPNDSYTCMCISLCTYRVGHMPTQRFDFKKVDKSPISISKRVKFLWWKFDPHWSICLIPNFPQCGGTTVSLETKLLIRANSLLT